MRITGTIDFCLEKGEYDQGDFCTVHYDDLHDLKHDLERQLAEAREEAKRIKEAIKLNFVDVKRTKCCTDTALWILDKLKEKGE